MRPKKYFFSKKKSKIFFWKKFFFQIFPIVVPWIFLSLRYGADLGRSRLFSSDYNPHTDRSTFYNSAQSTWGQVRPRQTLLQRVPPLFFTFSRKHTKPDVPKGSPLWIFFGTVRLFFENFLMSPKGPPFEFFDILNGMFVNKSRRVPLLHFSALCDFFWKKIFFKNFNFFSKKSVLRFLSLRYGADFRRSRLVELSASYCTRLFAIRFVQM